MAVNSGNLHSCPLTFISFNWMDECGWIFYQITFTHKKDYINTSLSYEREMGNMRFFKNTFIFYIYIIVSLDSLDQH